MDFQINLDPAMLGGAGIVFVVGMGIVFIVLVLLILLLTLEAKLFTALGNKKNPKAEKKAAPVPVAASVPTVTAAEDEEEIAAVIAAVVAMYSESGSGLVVRSVRRVGANTPAWSVSGRQEYVNTRY